MNPEMTSFGPKTWLQHFWYAIFRLFGWRVAGDLPLIPKYLIIVAPHTSNLDFFIGMLANWACNIPDPHWLGKHTIFWEPVGTILRALGGIPLNRNSSRDFVQQVVDEFERRDKLVLALAPEGTRSYTDHWKSGFYYMALKAQVPVYPMALDFKRKVITAGAGQVLTGDMEADMAPIAAFYAEHGHGRNPEKQGLVRLRGMER